LFQGTIGAALSVTEEGEILSWNKAAEKLLGYSAREAVHKTCYDILEGMGALGTGVCHQHCSLAECTGGNTEIPSFDVSVKTCSRERLWINMSTIVFDNQGRRLVVQMARDITQQKETELLIQKMLELSKEVSSLTEASVRAEPAAALSEQEKHVLRLFAEGKDSDDVAHAFGN
jgi:PAS domain S-box-containing protein